MLISAVQHRESAICIHIPPLEPSPPCGCFLTLHCCERGCADYPPPPNATSLAMCEGVSLGQSSRTGAAGSQD